MILHRVWTLVLPLLAAAGLLLGGDAAYAKGGGGGHGGGGHGGGGHGGGGHGGGWHGGGGHGGYHGGYYHGGYNRGYYGWGGYGYGYYPYGLGIGLALGYGLGSGYGGYGGYGYSSGYGPGYYDGANLDYYYGQQPPPGYDPNMAGPGGAPNGIVNLTDGDVLFNVRVPANATVWVNGGQTTQTGPRREFMSSGLTPGKTYNFEIRAQWEQGGKIVDQTRKVPIQGGERRTVDFLSAPAAPPVPPAPKPLPPDGV
jgi:uncharacterized protein (TIGR03000 family)